MKTHAVQRSWRERAACQHHDPELWFPGRRLLAGPGKRICRTQCPVRDECLKYALDNREEWGVWGGLDPHERLGLRPGMYTPAGARPERCLVCDRAFQPSWPKARLCSESCRAARKRTREMAYVRKSGAETRLCPVCHRPVRPRNDNIPRHLDATGESMCPATNQPYSITLPDPTGGVAS